MTRPLFACLAVAGFLTGCAGHESVSPPVLTDKVVIPGAWTFGPPNAEVKVGSTVTFENHGGAAHTVTFDDGFDQTILAGGSITRTFDLPGTYAYHCKFHPPNMKGTIIVSNTPS